MLSISLFEILNRFDFSKQVFLNTIHVELNDLVENYIYIYIKLRKCCNRKVDSLQPFFYTLITEENRLYLNFSHITLL